MTTLDWSQWYTIGSEQVSEMINVQESQKGSGTKQSNHKSFLKTIALRAPWKVVCVNIHKNSLSSQIVSDFFTQLTCFLSTCLMKPTIIEVDEKFLDFAQLLVTNEEMTWNVIEYTSFSTILLKHYSRLLLEAKKLDLKISKKSIELSFRILECICKPVTPKNPAQPSLFELNVLYPIYQDSQLSVEENPNFSNGKPLLLAYIDFLISTIEFCVNSRTLTAVDLFMSEESNNLFEWVIDQVASYRETSTVIDLLTQLLTFTTHLDSDFDNLFKILICKAFEHQETLSLPLLDAAQSVKNYPKLVLLMEHSIRAHLKNPSGTSNWQNILRHTWMPDNDQQKRQFASTCIEKGCPTLLFVHVLQRMMAESSYLITQFEKMVEEYILNLNVFCPEQVELSEAIGINQNPKENYLLPLWSLYINIFLEVRKNQIAPPIKDTRSILFLNNVVNPNNYPVITPQFQPGFEGLVAFTNLLLTISGERSMESTLSKMVSFMSFSKKNPEEVYKEDFKSLCRILGVYLLNYTAKHHVDDQKATKELQRLKANLNNKQTKTIDVKEKRSIETFNRYIVEYGDGNFMFGLLSLLHELHAIFFYENQTCLLPTFQ